MRLHSLPPRGGMLLKKWESGNSLVDDLHRWYEMEGCLVLLPSERVPRSIIHFIGGFLAGSSVQVAYSACLSYLAKAGHLVIATPIPAVDLNHTKVAREAFLSFSTCYSRRIRPLLGNMADEVPIIGLSHSLGGKLTVLAHSDRSLRHLIPRNKANIFLSFNNFGLLDSLDSSRRVTSRVSPAVREVALGKQTLPDASSFSPSSSISDKRLSAASSGMDNIDNWSSLVSDLASGISDWLGSSKVQGVAKEVSRLARDLGLDLDFQPSPKETWKLLLEGYNVHTNYFIRFDEDDLDQAPQALPFFAQRGCEAHLLNVKGNHLTPNTLFLPLSAYETEEDYRKDQEQDLQFVQLLAALCGNLADGVNGEEVCRRVAYLPASSNPPRREQKSSDRRISRWDSDNY